MNEKENNIAHLEETDEISVSYDLLSYYEIYLGRYRNPLAPIVHT